MMRFFESAAEAALVRRAQAGQREAFAALVDRYLPLVHSLALAHTGRIHDADDIAQETFLRALERLATLREPRLFASWLAAIARNLAMDTHRERARIAPGAVPETAVEPAYDRTEIHALVHEKLDALDPQSREILWLHYYGGYSVRAAARHLGIQAEAAKKRLQRARAALGAEIMTSLAPDAAVWIAKRQLVLAAIAKAPTAESAAVAQSAIGAATLPFAVKLAAGLAATGAIVTAAIFAALPDAPPAPTRAIAQAPAASSAEPAPPPPAPIPATAAALASSPTVIEVVENEPAAPAAAGSTVRVSGKVVDRRGLPIPGIRINHQYHEYVPGESRSKPTQTLRSTVSGADGAYALEVSYGVEHSLRLESGDGFKESSHHLIFSSDEPRDDLDFILEGEYAHRIEGVVLAPDGTPCPDVSVGGKEPQCYAQSDENGRFTLLGLELGERPALRAEKRGVGSVDFGQIAAGTYDVVIQLGAPYAIAGRVTYPDGSPVTEFDVYPRFTSGMHAQVHKEGWSAVSDPEGRFRIDGLTGDTNGVSARAAGYAPTAVFLDASHGAPIEDAVIRLEPESRIAGRVTTPEGVPIEGAAIRVSWAALRVSWAYEPDRESAGVEVYSDADGRYRIAGLGAGEYPLKATAPGKKSKRQYIAVSAEEEVVLDWVMAPGGSITLRFLQDGKPVAGEVQISNSGVSPMLSSRGIPKRNFDDPLDYSVVQKSYETGVAVFDDLPEQTYYILARIDTPDKRNAGFGFTGFGGNGAPPGVKVLNVLLGPGESFERDLEFEAGSRVAGLGQKGGSRIAGLVQNCGVPVSGATVSAVVETAGVEERFRTNTDGTGRFVLDNIPDGAVRMSVHYQLQAASMIAISRHIHLAPGETRVEDFDRSDTGELDATCDADTGLGRQVHVLVLLPGVDIPDLRLADHTWGVICRYSATGSLNRPRLEAGAYRLVAMGRDNMLIAGPVDIEIRPGETTRVEF